MANPPLLDRYQELTLLELPEMVQHPDAGGVEVGGQFADTHPRRGLDQIEDPPAGGVAQRIEHRRHVIHR